MKDATKPHDGGSHRPKLVARLKLLRDDEPRWRALCSQPITDRPGQSCPGMLGYVFGVRHAVISRPRHGAWELASTKMEAVPWWLRRWGPPGTNILHLLTVEGFYDSHMSGWPPDKWVLTHPDGLRRLPGGTFGVLARTRSAANGQRVGRRSVPPVLRGSDFVQLDPKAMPVVERVRSVHAASELALAGEAAALMDTPEIQRLRASVGGRFVVGHRAELPAAVVCPHCRRPNAVPVPEWTLDYGLDGADEEETYE